MAEQKKRVVPRLRRRPGHGPRGSPSLIEFSKRIKNQFLLCSESGVLAGRYVALWWFAVKAPPRGLRGKEIMFLEKSIH